MPVESRKLPFRTRTVGCKSRGREEEWETGKAKEENFVD
jgi:hypothetical protein